MAFCEPFNEQLGELTRQEARNVGPSTWPSGHPGTKAYFAEFFPLFTASRGVEGFNLEFAYQRFVPEDGFEGNLDDEQIHYVDNMLDLARTNHKIPVIAFTRSLGRLLALKRAFGGVHVFIYRNLYDQWMSYLGQYQGGNSFFIQTLARVINGNHHVQLFRKIGKKYWKGPDIDTPYAGFQTAENALCAFLGVHMYLYMHASQTADIILNTTKIGKDPSYRQCATEAIATISGLKIDLADAKTTSEYGGFEISQPIVDEVLYLVDSVYKHSLTPAAREFGQDLRTGLFADMAQTNISAKAAYAKLMKLNDRLNAELAKVNKENCSLKRELENERQVSLRALSELSEMRTSSSWKMTAPIRKAMMLARGA